MSTTTRDFNYSAYKAQLKGSKMAKLQQQIEFYTRKIDQENQKLNQINIQIAQLERDLEQKRLEQTDKAKKREEDPIALSRKNKGLQLKLDGIRQKKNTIEAENQHLKQEINNLRRERNLFNKIYEKLKLELTEKKEDLRKIITESKFAHNYIEQAQKELVEQQKQAFSEQRKFEKEFQLNKVDEDVKIQPQIQISQKGSTSPLARNQKTSSVNNSTLNAINVQSQLDIVEAPAQLTKQFLIDRQQMIKEEEKQLKELTEKVCEYEVIIKELLQQTNCKNMAEVVKTFIEYEEENYILFRNVNQLDDEYELLLRQKKKLQEELSRLENMPKESIQDIKAYKIQSGIQMIEEAKQRKLKLKAKLDEQMDSWAQIQKIVPQMQEKMLNIASNLGLEHLDEFIQKEDDLTMNNIQKYMGKLETLTQKIIQEHTQSSQSVKLIDRRHGKLLEDSNNSSHMMLQPANEDFDKAQVNRLEEEFKSSIEKALDDRRVSGKEQETKDKFLKYTDLKDLAEKEYKKYQFRRGTNRKHPTQTKIQTQMS